MLHYRRAESCCCNVMSTQNLRYGCDGEYVRDSRQAHALLSFDP
jgi:hypothetical protein